MLLIGGFCEESLCLALKRHLSGNHLGTLVQVMILVFAHLLSLFLWSGYFFSKAKKGRFYQKSETPEAA